jgi:hypothetical protein
MIDSGRWGRLQGAGHCILPKEKNSGKTRYGSPAIGRNFEQGIFFSARTCPDNGLTKNSSQNRFSRMLCFYLWGVGRFSFVFQKSPIVHLYLP